MDVALGIGPRPSVVLGKAKTGRVDVAILVCDSGNRGAVVLEGDVNLLSRLLGLALANVVPLGLERHVLPDNHRCKVTRGVYLTGLRVLPANELPILVARNSRDLIRVDLLIPIRRVIGEIHRGARLRVGDAETNEVPLRLRCSRTVVALSKGRGHRAHYRAQGQHSPQACCDCDVFAVELHAAIPPCSLLKRQTFLEGGHIVG